MDDPRAPEAKAEPLTTHHLGLLVEMFETTKKTILEGMAAMEERLERKWDARFERIEQRLDVLELAVRKNSEDIRKNSEDIRKNSEDIARLSREVVELRARVESLERKVEELSARVESLEGKVDDIDSTLSAIEERVLVLETKLGIAQRR